MTPRWPGHGAIGIGAFVLLLVPATRAAAQAHPHPQGGWTAGVAGPGDAGGSTASTGLRGRSGTDIAVRLARSSDPDDRLRAIERLASTHTTEALALLERAAEAGVPGPVDSRAQLEGVARRDPRALLAVVHGLAGWVDREPARAALASIVAAPSPSLATRGDMNPAADSGDDESADEAEGAAAVVLARQEAAIALADSGDVPSLEALIAVARSAGPGQGPALDALAIHPPAPPLLGGVVLTTPATVALAVATGDLRSLDAVDGAMSASDPALRAAALAALGLAGDSRVLDGARAALGDHDARVRLAAGDALVRLGAPDAARAVEGLIADDATVLGALRLAELAQGEGVTKAAAARAVASASAEVRADAVAALGRQSSPLAIEALATLVSDPAMQGDAMCAMARSPSPAAMAAIEAVAGPWPRMAARGYFLRRFVRGEDSARLDALLERLAGSRDARDRAVAAEALVALGRRPVGVALEDPDPRVRRAAAAGAAGAREDAGRAALLARLGVETDPTTRDVLAIALAGGDPEAMVPTEELLRRARGGGADAPLSALALAARADPARAADVDALLRARDPVLRAHVARGLGASPARDAIGRLAGAYAKEGDVQVRRAIIAALAARPAAASAPAARGALQVAARLDPDRIVRSTAQRALSGAASERRSHVREVAWLRIVPAEGAALPGDVTGALLQDDDVALPFAFDEEGYALVPGVAPGSARVRLAPRLAPYESASP